MTISTTIGSRLRNAAVIKLGGRLAGPSALDSSILNLTATDSVPVPRRSSVRRRWLVVGWPDHGILYSSYYTGFHGLMSARANEISDVRRREL